MKKLIWIAGIGLALTLTACGGKDSPKASTFSSYSGTAVLPSSTSTTLQPSAWTAGAGTIKGYVDTTLLTTGTLNANGNFSINLPVPDSSLLAAPSSTNPADSLVGTFDSCSQNTVKLSDASAKFATVTLVAAVEGEEMALSNLTMSILGNSASLQEDETNFGLFVYSDRPTNMTGSMTCTDNSSDYKETQSITLNVALGKGWNKVSMLSHSKTTSQTRTMALSIKSGTLPADNWYAGFGLGAIPLDLVQGKTVK